MSKEKILVSVSNNLITVNIVYDKHSRVRDRMKAIEMLKEKVRGFK